MMNLESGPQIDLVGALRRRAWLIAAIGGAVFLAGYWIAMALPNEYEAYATLLVEPQAVSESIVASGVGGSDLNNRLHIMSAEILSRSRLSRIIDDLSLYPEKADSMSRSEVVDLMRSKIRIVPLLPELQPGTQRREVEITTFQVHFSARSPRVAADVAQRLANDFIEEHIAARVVQSQKSLEFIAGSTEKLQREAAEVESAIARIKRENPGRLPEDLDANQRLLERTIGELRSSQRQLDLARSDQAFYRSQGLVAATASARDDTSPLRRRQLLELALTEYRGKGYTERHPDMIKTKQEIEEIQREIQAALESEEENEELSYAQQTLKAEIERSELRVKATESETKRLEEQQNELIERIQDTPRVAEQLERLERRMLQLSSSLKDASNRHQQATVQADLERRQLGEQFRIIEAAFPPPTPSSPDRLLILGLSLVLGLAAGAGAAIIAEASDNSMHGPRQLQTAFSIPVLASIPSILFESERAAQARKRVRQVVAAAVVVTFCLTGGLATYMLVNGAPGWLLPGDDEEQESEALPQEDEQQDASLWRTPVRG